MAQTCEIGVHGGKDILHAQHWGWSQCLQYIKIKAHGDLSWVPSPALCGCSKENPITAQRSSPLLEPASGSMGKGNLPGLVLRSDTLPKLFSLVCQHRSLSSPISFSSVLSFIISQVPQWVANRNPPSNSSAHLSLFLA